jgi:hypothetical protein
MELTALTIWSFGKRTIQSIARVNDNTQPNLKDLISAFWALIRTDHDWLYLGKSGGYGYCTGSDTTGSSSFVQPVTRLQVIGRQYITLHSLGQKARACVVKRQKNANMHACWLMLADGAPSLVSSLILKQARG